MKLVPERDPLTRHLALVYLALAGLGALVVLVWGRYLEQIAFCPLRHHTGLPCPTCGGTHAVLALARFDLLDAWQQNPLVCLAVLVLIIWAGFALLTTWQPRWRRQILLNPRERKLLRISLVMIFLGSWVYQIARLT